MPESKKTTLSERRAYEEQVIHEGVKKMLDTAQANGTKCVMFNCRKMLAELGISHTGLRRMQEAIADSLCSTEICDTYGVWVPAEFELSVHVLVQILPKETAAGEGALETQVANAFKAGHLSIYGVNPDNISGGRHNWASLGLAYQGRGR